jgi:hypothetical protein
MGVLRGLIEEAAAGETAPADIAARAWALPLLDNYRRFGNFCGQHCQIIAMHHGIEDEAIFAPLAGKSAAFARVVVRLIAEHRAIHTQLVALSAALEALAAAPDAAGFAAARTLFDRLEAALNSHFSYEEHAIGDALGYYGIGV